jgi:hypothetical protein
MTKPDTEGAIRRRVLPEEWGGYEMDDRRRVGARFS